jgi:hypothetical protein
MGLWLPRQTANGKLMPNEDWRDILLKIQGKVGCGTYNSSSSLWLLAMEAKILLIDNKIEEKDK